MPVSYMRGLIVLILISFADKANVEELDDSNGEEKTNEQSEGDPDSKSEEAKGSTTSADSIDSKKTAKKQGKKRKHDQPKDGIKRTKKKLKKKQK